MEEGGGRRRWSALEILLAGEAAVAVIVLAVGWWPVRGDTQSPLDLEEGLNVAFVSCMVAFPFIALLATALRAKNDTVRALFGTLLGLASGLVTFFLAAVTAMSRLEDQHEA